MEAKTEKKSIKSEVEKKMQKKCVPRGARPELVAAGKCDKLVSGTPPGLPKVTKVTLFCRKDENTWTDA